MPIDEYISKLTAAPQTARVKTAASFLGIAKRRGYSLDDRLDSNCPTFREVAEGALKDAGA